MSYLYYCTRCKLRKEKTKEEPAFIFNTELEVLAHLKMVHGIDNPSRDTVDDYSVGIGISLPERTVKRLQRKGSPFQIERLKK